MSKSIVALRPLAVLPFAAIAVAIAGCPNTTETTPANNTSAQSSSSSTTSAGGGSSSVTSSSVTTAGNGGGGGSTSTGNGGGSVTSTGNGGAGGGLVCTGGKIPCGQPQACLDPTADNNNCGACGKVCMADSFCAASSCSYAISCTDLLTHTGPIADGTHTIQPAGSKPFAVYCAGMMTPSPKEYLTLQYTKANNFPMSNYSSFVSPGCGCGGDISRHFEKLRIDPATLTIDVADGTFATNVSSDLACWVGWANGMGGCQTGIILPYAWAGDCQGVPAEPGNLDLRGLPFSLDPSVVFIQMGSGAYGTSVVSPDRKQATLSGGGDCGWTFPSAALVLKQD